MMILGGLIVLDLINHHRDMGSQMVANTSCTKKRPMNAEIVLLADTFAIEKIYISFLYHLFGAVNFFSSSG